MGDLHPAVEAWICHHNGWPPLYQQMADMPCEDAMGLLYLLKEDLVARDGEAAIETLQQTEAAIMARLMAPMRAQMGLH